ncbi:MAG: phage tail tip lysozyme [Actinomycetota bacterium]
MLAVLSVAFSPATAGAASGPGAGPAGSVQELLSCQAYLDAQRAGAGINVSTGLRSAARHAAIAARTARRWQVVASRLRYAASLPDAMLTKAQLRKSRRNGRVIQRACAAAGASLTVFPRRESAVKAAPLTPSMRAAWTYFVGSTSLTAVQAAGLEGNLMVESGLNPGIKQKSCASCGYGIAQWTVGGSRYANLVKFAKTLGLPVNNLSAQLQFVWSELTSNSGYGLAALKKCTTTKCATNAVMTKYERPAVQATDCAAKGESYCLRLADANEVLAAYPAAPPATAVQIVRNPAGQGYWLLSAQGGVYSYGGAPFYGSAAGKSSFAGQTAVRLAAAPAGTGYWIVSASGGIYPFGSAKSYGAAAGQSSFAGQTAVGMAVNPAGTGYWIVSASGGIYPFGSAKSYGAAAGHAYFAGQTAVGMAVDPAGTGYWIVSASGGVRRFGSAKSYSAVAGQALFAGQTAVGMAVDPAGTGYWIVSASGGVYSFGSAKSYGAAAGQPYFAGKTAVALAGTAAGGGYLVASGDGGVYTFGDAVNFGGGV